VVRATLRSLCEHLVELNENEVEIGGQIGSHRKATVASELVLGACPVCKTGTLRLIKSRKTRKRFVGCTNYPSGCRASAPLPQRGSLKAVAKPCSQCGWPMVGVWNWRFQWKVCINRGCPSKVGKSREVRAM